MTREDLAARVAGVAALADPVRRDLYLYVSAQPAPVSRDQASDALGIARHTAKFHLDKLAEEGLLDISFKRLSERRGPGAGRPTKLYARSSRQLSVILPERRYDLAGQLLATAIDDAGRARHQPRRRLESRGRWLGQQRRRPSPSSCRPSTKPRAASGLHLPGSGRERVRTTPHRWHRRAAQLPLRCAGPRTHRTGLRHESRHHDCRDGATPRDCPRCPARACTGPLLCCLGAGRLKRP